MNVFILRNNSLASNAGMLRIIDANVKNGHQSFVISRNRKKTQEKTIFQEDYNYQGILVENHVIELFSKQAAGLKNLIPLIKYQFLLLSILWKERNKIDVIHSFDLDTGLVSLLFTKLFRKKMVYHIADFYSDSRANISGRVRSMIKKIEVFVINHADATIIANENRKEQIEGSKPKNLTVIHNSPMVDAVALERAIRETKIEQLGDERISLCYVGGLSSNRFIHEILEFIAGNQELTLTLAGYGELEEKVRTYAKEYENIHYLGELAYLDSLALYSYSDIMFAMYDPTHPNHKYSAPNKVYEAMMLNKPIIVAKDSGVDQLVSKENIGLISKYTIEDFEATLKTLVTDKRLIETYRDNSKNSYTQYSWDKMVLRLDNLYKNL